MLFVDDDQAELRQWCENGRARADHHVHLAPADAVPLVVPLAVGQPAVLDRDAAAARRVERSHHGRRQGDLGHEHQHTAPLPPHVSGQLQVDGGLPAPRHAVQQRDTEPFLRRPGGQAAQRRPLLGRQLHRPGAAGIVHPVLCGERITLDPPPFNRHQAAAGKPAHAVRRNAVSGQLGRGEPGRGRREQRQRAALARAERRGRTAPGNPVSRRGKADGADGSECGDAGRAGGRPAGPGEGRHGRRHRVARAAGVVLGDPGGEIEHRRGQERVDIEALDQLPQLGPAAAIVVRRAGQHATGDLAVPERHAHARTRRRHRHAVGHAIGQCGQKGYGNRDRDEPGHHPSRRMLRTFFMSSHTSRLRSGLRSRNAG